MSYYLETMINEAEAYLILVLFLLVFASLLSCFETSITAVSRARIHRLASEGDKRAKHLDRILREREKVVSVMLLANNVVNIAASAITTRVVLKLFGEEWFLVATVVLTIAVIIFSEILPKTIAIKFSEKVALFFAPSIHFLFFIFSPIVAVIQRVVDMMIGVFFTNVGKKTKESELEEIRDTVDLKAKEGSIFKYDKDLLDGVLDLSDTAISEIVTHRKDIESIDISLSIAEIAKQGAATNHTRIPLWRGSKESIVAVLNVRKLLRALHSHRGDIEKFELSSVTSAPWFVPATNSLRSQLFAFRKKKKHFALVVDEYGSLLGLITLEDILEEIVGEIKEEEDSHGINIIKIKSGAYKIAGKTLIRDINKKLDLEIEESDDAYNLAAFVINSLGRIPEEKENFVINGHNFEILKKHGHDLVWIKCRKV
jgi:Mg2+/Co2+ transporter CorB